MEYRKMKKTLLITLLLFISSNYAQNRGLGLGIILGEPTGLSAKLMTNHINAIDFAAAWSLENERNILLHADYLWHNFDLIEVHSGRLPLYYGIGGRMILSTNLLAGIRIPIGLDYQFENSNIEIFLEIVPMLDLIPSTEYILGAGFGVRLGLN
jgi:hypothetical protein